MKRMFLCLMALLMVFSSLPCSPVMFISSAVSQDGNMNVTASSGGITVKIDAVGASGKADVIKMPSNHYFDGDGQNGLSLFTSQKGEVIGTYNCGTSEEFLIPRYTKTFEDNIYCKYYVVQNGSILYGPVYVTDIYAPDKKVSFSHNSNKGLYADVNTDIDTIEKFGCSNVTLEIDLSKLFYANEDKSGIVLDQSINSDAIKFVSGGNNYYFSNSYIKDFDSFLSQLALSGINVSLKVVASRTSDWSRYPYALVYTTGTVGDYTAFNTSTEKGNGYFVAAMEFLAERYSNSVAYGYVQNFIIGNEIDNAYLNYAVSSIYNETTQGKVSLEVFAEEYARTLRLANNAVKKYSKNMTVSMSLSNSWTKSSFDNTDVNDSSNSYINNSYASKAVFDTLSEKLKEGGDFDWGLEYNPGYAADFVSADGVAADTGAVALLDNTVTGSYETSPVITFSNLEVLDSYLSLSKNKFCEEKRSLYVKGGASSAIMNGDSKNFEKQSANLAYAYYKSAHLDSVKAFSCIYKDKSDKAPVGLVGTDGNKKLSYSLYISIDTDKSFDLSASYLDYISFRKGSVIYSKAQGNVTSYKDTMNAVDTDFNWSEKWSEDKISVRIQESADEFRLSLEKFVFEEGEKIFVTACGNKSSYVAIYKKGDVTSKVDPIYWYYTDGENKGVNHTSGSTYAIQDGSLNASRSDLKDLPKGDYKVILFEDGNGKIYSETEISVVKSGEFYLATDKTEYKYGEDILVSADCNLDGAWVGLYKPNEIPGSINSIFWFNTKDADGSVVFQKQEHNNDSSNPSSVLAVGNYVLYLFDSSKYNSIMSKSISVVSDDGSLAAFDSVEYKLEDEIDGFANGTVIVRHSGKGRTPSDCELYWADDNGPLEGYSALAKFKITGRVTRFKMYTHTIIPEGATRLLAYAISGNIVSQEYAETKLPENCTYKLSDDFDAEFQLVSDIHIGDAYGANHFKNFLEDVVKNSKDSIGIFINGDIANNGRADQYEQLKDIVKSVPGAPTLHLAMGNHDWYGGNPGNQFLKYINEFNPDANAEHLYYDEVVDGNYFIYLSSEKAGNNLHAYLSDAQHKWLREKLEAYTKTNPDKPVFVLLHQSFYNTIAGSLPGQGWNGIADEEALKNIFKDFDNVLFFGGHSHWELDSVSCMFPGDEFYPSAFNTASTSYLWTSYNIPGGEHLDGSEGYYVRVYGDKVVLMGRDFINGVFNPSAIFVYEKPEIKTQKDTYNVSLDSNVFNLGVTTDYSERIKYTSSDENVAVVDSLGNVSVKNLGTAQISIFAPASNTKTMSKKTVTVNVLNSMQNIVANNFVKTYGDTPFQINAKVNGTPVLSYSSSDDGVASVSSDGVVTVNGVGTAEITINAASDGYYEEAQKTITVTVVKASQEITAKDIVMSYSKTPFSLGAVLTVGDGALTYTSSNTDVAEVSSDGTVSLKGSGMARITVTAAETAFYRSAVKTVSLTVSKSSQVIDAQNITKTADEDTFSLSAKLTEGDGELTYKSDNASVASVTSDGVVTIVGAGTVNITVTASRTSAYNLTTKTIVLTVNRAEQTISASDIEKYYTAESFALGAVLEKGNGKLTYSSDNTSVAVVDESGNVTLKGKGTANITVTAAQTSKFAKAEKTVKITVIEKDAQVISASSVTKYIGTKPFSLGAKLTTGDGKLTYTSSNAAVASVSKDGVVTIHKTGTVTIKVSASSTEKYNSVAKNVTLKILPKVNQTISASNIKKYVGDSSFNLRAKLTKGNGTLSYKSSNTKVATVSSKGDYNQGCGYCKDYSYSVGNHEV